MYYVNVKTRGEAEEFCKWLLNMNPPFSICVNEGKVFNLSDNITKLYWLSGFQSLVDNKV